MWPQKGRSVSVSWVRRGYVVRFRMQGLLLCFREQPVCCQTHVFRFQTHVCVPLDFSAFKIKISRSGQQRVVIIALAAQWPELGGSLEPKTSRPAWATLWDPFQQTNKNVFIHASKFSHCSFICLPFPKALNALVPKIPFLFWFLEGSQSLWEPFILSVLQFIWWIHSFEFPILCEKGTRYHLIRFLLCSAA